MILNKADVSLKGNHVARVFLIHCSARRVTEHFTAG
jgi:hypothetical protein